jgi:hypothetical protein
MECRIVAPKKAAEARAIRGMDISVIQVGDSDVTEVKL